jgi:hypothetical protein
MITVICGSCHAEVGRFDAVDDHGMVLVACPKCSKVLEIHNQALLNHEYWSGNSQVTAEGFEGEVGEMSGPDPIQCNIIRPDGNNVLYGTPRGVLDEMEKALVGSGYQLDREQTRRNDMVAIVNVPAEIWHKLESRGEITLVLPSGYTLEAEMP